MTITIASSEVTAQTVDAILTLINPAGPHQSHVDKAIQAVAGQHFHRQLPAEWPLALRRVQVAEGNGATTFRHVVFVVDHWNRSLIERLQPGLVEVHRQGWHSIALSTYLEPRLNAYTSGPVSEWARVAIPILALLNDPIATSLNITLTA